MKVLVTGAAGFIGYHLIKKLTDNNETVVGIDNINDYYDISLKHARLEDCGIDVSSIQENLLIESYKMKRYSFQKTDLTDLKSLQILFANHNFDIVINLAAQAGVRYSLENPHVYVQSNIVGFVNLLECSRYANIKHFVYASSSSVYGMNSKIPFSEEDRVDLPISVYAATKRSNELLAYTYSHLYKLPTTGLRFFTVYGPYGRPDMAPMLFANAISKGKPIKVFNGGELQRDFTYVGDIVESLSRVVLKSPDTSDKENYYRLLNIGNSTPIKLMDFINTLELAIGKTAILEMFPMQPGDVTITYADTTKLEEIISYKAKMGIKDGMKYFVDWYKSYYGS